ncbi:MAG: lysophospholipid acyltransferase family protein [Pirellula sp.]|jgi:1-acyl-sn-glycerol-3-phosphate acyltransferase|nr:lysophospholipid acyltransferase family protein [Pirellula sp.]
MTRERESKRAESKLPTSSKWLVDGFCWYSRGLVRKQFQSMGFLGTEKLASIPDHHSTIVCANHASWWDPVVAMLSQNHYMSRRTLYAPIDADQLENYAVLKKMGFYGVRLQSFSGAQQFLETSKKLLANPSTSIWITPEGKFCDVRDHDQPLMPGMAHLVTKLRNTTIIPLALEYGFWDDSRPHIFGKFGEHINCEQLSFEDKSACNEHLTQLLRQTQRDLAQIVMKRDPQAFNYLVSSHAKRLSWYDFARKWAAWLKGRSFDPRHSASLKR